MMAGFAYLSGEAPPLAFGELKGAMRSMGLDPGTARTDGRAVILESPPPKGLARRLGFCHFTGALLDVTSIDMSSILDSAKGILEDAQPSSRMTVLVKAPRSGLQFGPKELFESLERIMRTKGSKVHHREPDHSLFVVIGSQAYIGWVLEGSGRERLLDRRGSKMPYSRPIMMEPRLARSLVNLSGLPPGSRILDPFLGTGGLAIETAHMGMMCAGIEIEESILEGARRNIRKEGLEGSIKTFLGDSRQMPLVAGLNELAPFDGIVTDPPFGRSASLKGSRPEELVQEVLLHASNLLKVRAPLVLDIHDGGMLDRLRGFELKEHYTFRIHKSLTRHIGVLAMV